MRPTTVAIKQLIYTNRRHCHLEHFQFNVAAESGPYTDLTLNEHDFGHDTS